MNRKYNLKLDLQFRCNNSTMKFNQFDNNTSDFFMRITNGGNLVDIEKAIVVLAIIKPSGKVASQFVEVENGLVYADLKPNMRDEIGIYTAQAMLILEDERVVTDSISYEVTEDKIFSLLNDAVATTEEFTMLTDMLSRISTIEIKELDRVENENSRIEAEKQREIAIENIKTQINNLILDTENTVDSFKVEAKEDINEYKEYTTNKLNNNLEEFKSNTQTDIQNYKDNKDTEINYILSSYKNNTTKEIEAYKEAKNSEINKYKENKSLEIDTKINKVSNELKTNINNYQTSKNKELDTYKNNKDTQINAKINELENSVNTKIDEINTTKEDIIKTSNNKINELEQSKVSMQKSVNAKIEEATNKVTELEGYSNRLESIEGTHETQNNRLDKVEYHNKVQDVYINGLFNENADGRLNIEGTGNNLKLEGSKQGLVTVDKVVGNTLVNRVVEDNKEFTFNGHIDTQGQNVTLTEGVDNGMVDVMCEGETLVNLHNKTQYVLATHKDNNGKYTVHTTETNNVHITIHEAITTWFYVNAGDIDVKKLKPNTKYTIVFEECLGVEKVSLSRGDALSAISPAVAIVNNKALVTTNDFSTDKGGNIVYCHLSKSAGTVIKIKNVIVLEGDWTDKKVPPYFEGMKSVGQDDANGHSVEIVSRNKNLFDPRDIIKGGWSDGFGIEITLDDGRLFFNGTTTKLYDFRPVEANWNKKLYDYLNKLPIGTTLTLSNNIGATNYWMLKRNGAYVYPSSTMTIQKGDTNISAFIRIEAGREFNNTELQIQLEIGDTPTPYIPYSSNTKNILLNEPLRGLPNGIKDRFVKKEGKWYVERNHIGLTLKADNISYVVSNKKVDTVAIAIKTPYDNNFISNMIICDKFPIGNANWVALNNTLEKEQIELYGNYMYININKSRLDSDNYIPAMKTWITNNPLTVVARLATPIYEELQINPTLNTYNDITHISNNSIIPCNMQVKNTGLSLVGLAPNAKYTVVHNGSGTVGAYVGGSGGTTSTNGKIVITTPDLITDNEVRLYGKGVNVSDVMVLGGEVEHTNGSFKGLQSSFESELVTDENDANFGKYKVDVNIYGENIQLAEGTQATPYYGRKSTVYLNSPLLKGDELVMKEDGLYHYHNMYRISDFSNVTITSGNNLDNNVTYMGRIRLGVNNLPLSDKSLVICNKHPYVSSGIWTNDFENICIGDIKLGILDIRVNKNRLSDNTVSALKEFLINNDFVVDYLLSEPYYEKISDNQIIAEIPSNATLTLNSVIPCTDVRASYTGNVPSIYCMEKSITDIEQHNVDIVATTWDMDYRLLEVEWTLEDAGLTDISLVNTFNLSNTKGVKSMALSRYEQAKIMILGGAYDKEVLTKQLTRYEQKGLITTEEYEELLSLMEAKELVIG